MQTTQEEAVIPTTNEASSQESAAGLPAEEERKEQETNSFQVTAYAQKKGLEVIYIRAVVNSGYKSVENE